MKPTDEERREVAENLRNMCCCGCRYAEQFYELLKETVMDSWDFHEFGDVAERLADLIEPAPERTCRVLTEKRTFSQTQEIHIKLCSACGRMFGAEKHCQLLPGLDEEFVLDDVQIPSYCPLCGAKVIEEES